MPYRAGFCSSLVIPGESQGNTARIAPFIIPRYLDRVSTRVGTSVGHEEKNVKQRTKVSTAYNSAIPSWTTLVLYRQWYWWYWRRLPLDSHFSIHRPKHTTPNVENFATDSSLGAQCFRFLDSGTALPKLVQAKNGLHSSRDGPYTISGSTTSSP